MGACIILRNFLQNLSMSHFSGFLSQWSHMLLAASSGGQLLFLQKESPDHSYDCLGIRK